jgi:hypothetical protein
MLPPPHISRVCFFSIFMGKKCNSFLPYPLLILLAILYRFRRAHLMQLQPTILQVLEYFSIPIFILYLCTGAFLYVCYSFL